MEESKALNGMGCGALSHIRRVLNRDNNQGSFQIVGSTQSSCADEWNPTETVLNKALTVGIVTQGC